MLHKRHFRTGLVVERNGLFKNAEVSGFLYICDSTEDEPHRVIVETASDVVVSPLCKRLVLVIAASVRELGGSDVDDSFACSFRNLMNEAHEILVGVAKAHSSTDSTLEEGGRTGHIECDHTLVLVPDVDHPVHLFLLRLHYKDVKEGIPVGLELRKGSVHFSSCVEGGYHLLSFGLVDYRRRSAVKKSRGRFCKLLLLLVLHITEKEYEILALACLQLHLDVV